MDAIEKVEKPISPIMPVMGNLMTNAMPVPVPQMNWESGIVAKFFHNVKLGQMEKATYREAAIAENKERMVRANTAIMFELMTFSARVEDQFDEYNFRKESRKVALEDAKAKLTEQQLKNQVLYGEVQLNEIEVKIKKKQLEEMLGGVENE